MGMAHIMGALCIEHTLTPPPPLNDRPLNFFDRSSRGVIEGGIIKKAQIPLNQKTAEKNRSLEGLNGYLSYTNIF